MKLSELKTQIDKIIELHGDIDLGSPPPQSVEFRHGHVGWAGGWSTRIVTSGIYWWSQSEEHFIGQRAITPRVVWKDSYAPEYSDMGETVTTEVVE